MAQLPLLHRWTSGHTLILCMCLVETHLVVHIENAHQNQSPKKTVIKNLRSIELSPDRPLSGKKEKKQKKQACKHPPLCLTVNVDNQATEFDFRHFN